MNDVRCRDAATLACDARDRALDATEQEDLGRHLAQCAYCRIASQQFRELYDQLDELLACPAPRTISPLP
jgi:hypothetical protein